MKQKTLITDFTQGNIVAQLFRFSLPLLLSNMLQIFYNMIDMVIVGRAMGNVGLSAVSIGGDIVNLMTFLSMGFSNASQVLIAQYIGAGKDSELGRFLGTMTRFVTCMAVSISVVCYILRHVLLHLMNTPAKSYEETLAYATYSIIGLIFIFGYNFCGAVLRGLGDSFHPFLFISLAAVMNVLLDLTFVLGFKMGAGGAAIATVMSQGLSFVLCMGFFYRERAHLGIRLKKEYFRKMDRQMVMSLISLGLPMALKSASIQFSKLFVNSWINSYGLSVSAFAGVANKINSTCNLISNAFNTAGSSMVGQNLAAKQIDRVKKLFKTIYMVVLSIDGTLCAILLLFPRVIYSFFKLDEAGISVGMQYLPIAVLIFLGSALRCPNNALINGSGNVKINFLTAILDGIVLRIGFGLLFGLALDMKYLGFWLGDGVAGFTPFVLGSIFYISGKWKYAKIQKQ